MRVEGEAARTRFLWDNESSYGFRGRWDILDIAYLLALQNLRQSLPHAFEQFFGALSFIGEGPLLVAAALIVYWSVDKRAGLFALFAMGLGNLVNQLVKNIACAYRPWIRDTRIVPSAYAIAGATGYSFPSGHTCATTTVAGSFAWEARGGKHRGFVALCIAFIVLMGFSRNFLGVHTPQDVLVGLAVGVAGIAGAQVLVATIERADRVRPQHKLDVAVVAVIWGVCIAQLIFVVFKPYPHDFVDGVLLVDPLAMQKGSFQATGILCGLSLGWLLERRHVGFSTEGLTLRVRAMRAIVGGAIAIAFFLVVKVALSPVLDSDPLALAEMLACMFASLFVAPAAFMRIERRRGCSSGGPVQA